MTALEKAGKRLAELIKKNDVYSNFFNTLSKNLDKAEDIELEGISEIHNDYDVESAVSRYRHLAKHSFPEVGDTAVCNNYEQTISEIKGSFMYLSGGMKTMGWVQISNFVYSEIAKKWVEVEKPLVDKTVN